MEFQTWSSPKSEGFGHNYKEFVRKMPTGKAAVSYEFGSNPLLCSTTSPYLFSRAGREKGLRWKHCQLDERKVF
jgi:hypothetical protein